MSVFMPALEALKAKRDELDRCIALLTAMDEPAAIPAKTKTVRGHRTNSDLDTKIGELIEAKVHVNEIAKKVGCSRAKVYSVKKKMKT